MLRRLLTYPFGNARARAMAAELMRPEDVVRLAGATSRDADNEIRRRLNLPAGGGTERGLYAAYLAFGRKVVRSLPPAAGDLVQTYLDRAAFENLKVVCRVLLQGGDQGNHVRLPYPPQKRLPEEALKANSLEELAGRLPAGRFRQLVREIRLSPADERLFILETRLDRLFWEEICERIGRLSPFDRLAAREILGQRADMERLRIVGRGLRDGQMPDTVAAALPPLGLLFPLPGARNALRSADPAAALKRLHPPGAPPDLFSPAGEVFLRRRLYRFLRRTLISPPFDISVPLSALLLKELETGNLQAVLGGLRLGAAEGIPQFLSFGRA